MLLLPGKPLELLLHLVELLPNLGDGLIGSGGGFGLTI
jgi:hypothetical protein